MGLGKPSGSDEMLEPGGWPDADEDAFNRVAEAYTRALQTLRTNSTTPWTTQVSDTFHNGGGHWIGGASGAAATKGSSLSDAFTTQEQLLTRAANWNYNTAGVISGAKNRITSSLLEAWGKINAVKPTDEDAQLQIDNLKKQYLKVHQGIVGDAARDVQTPDTYKPDQTTNQLLSKDVSTNKPPVGAAPGTPPGTIPGQRGSTEVTLPQSAPAPAGMPPATAPTAGTTPATQAPVTRGQTSSNEGQNGPQQSTPSKTTQSRGDTVPAEAQSQPTQGQVPNQAGGAASPSVPGSAPAPVVAPSSPGARPTSASPTTGGTPAVSASSGSSSPTGGLGGVPSGAGTPQSGNPSGQPTGAQTPGGQPTNPLQQGLQQFGQGLQSGAGNASQPLASAQPATQQPTTPPPATPTGAAGGTSGTSAAPVGAASAAGGGGSVGGPAAATPAAPAAPLGPAPTPSPAAPVAQPGQGGPVGPAGPGVAAAGTNNQQAAAAAAPIPVSPARAERDAMAAAAKAGLLQRKSAGNTDADIEIARRISAALHAPPSIPAASYQFVWAVGVTSEGQILAANSYGIGYIPDGVKLPGQVTLVSADEAISPAERGRWVNFPFLAIQGWAQFHNKTLRAIIGTPEEVKPYKSSMHAEELAPDDIPADGTMQGRSRLQVIAPEAAARLEEWSDVTLYEALPPRPVQDAPPDAKQTMKLWVETIKPLLRTTGTNGPIDHLTKLIAYADHMQNVELYKAYTAPHVAAQREAMSDWIYWQHVSSICQDATNPVLGSVQA